MLCYRYVIGSHMCGLSIGTKIGDLNMTLNGVMAIILLDSTEFGSFGGLQLRQCLKIDE